LSVPLKFLDRVLFGAIVMLLAAMVVDVTIQVLFRYIIQQPPTWTEEAARFLLTWQVFLAAALAFGRGSHIAVDALQRVMPIGVRRPVLVGTNALLLLFLIVLTWQGVSMVGMAAGTDSPALGLNMAFVYAALPVGAAFSSLYVFLQLLNQLRPLGKKPGAHCSASVE